MTARDTVVHRVVPAVAAVLAGHPTARVVAAVLAGHPAVPVAARVVVREKDVIRLAGLVNSV